MLQNRLIQEQINKWANQGNSISVIDEVDNELFEMSMNLECLKQ